MNILTSAALIHIDLILVDSEVVNTTQHKTTDDLEKDHTISGAYYEDSVREADTHGLEDILNNNPFPVSKVCYRYHRVNTDTVWIFTSEFYFKNKLLIIPMQTQLLLSACW